MNSLVFMPVRLFSRSSLLEAKKKAAEIVLQEVVVPVEKDTQKLATYVCGSNLFNEGEDVKLKPDSEYPEWLWSIRSPPPLEELDKNSKTYWNRIRTQREREKKYLMSLERNTTVHK